jgi:putative peptidoglycan lipid II flippase
MTAFWAHQDTMTPVKIAIITSLSNIALSLLLIGILGVAGIALSTGVVGWLQVYLLHRKLKGRDALEFDDRLRSVFPKIALCSCIMGIVLAVLAYVLTPYFGQRSAYKNMCIDDFARGRRTDLCAGHSAHGGFEIE